MKKEVEQETFHIRLIDYYGIVTTFCICTRSKFPLIKYPGLIAFIAGWLGDSQNFTFD